LLCYHGTTSKALLQLFPEIGLEKKRFMTDPGKKNRGRGGSVLIGIPVNMQWQYPQKRRTFFEKFALLRAFDPLVPSNWYSISLESILEQKVFTHSKIEIKNIHIIIIKIKINF
jgi:hypothetical protein